MENNLDFKVHGIYTVSNSIGLEIELSNDGDSARTRYTDSNGKQIVSDWNEIQYKDDEDNSDNTIPCFMDGELEIELTQVMRIR